MYIGPMILLSPLFLLLMGWTVPCVSGFNSALSTFQAPTARSVIESAIKAHGGVEALKRAAACQRSEKGKLIQPSGTVLVFQCEATRSLPERLRLEITPEKGTTIITVLDGGKGWLKATGPSVPLVAQAYQELREESTVVWLSTLVPLLDPSFTLTLAGNGKVDGVATQAVTASRKGERDTTFHFSTASGLLVKIVRRVPSAGVLADKEYLYQKYKDFNGAQLPTREVQTLNGRVNTEVDIQRWTFTPGGPAARLFERP